MGHVFSVELPFGFEPSSFDVFDVEPDLDGVDWVEEDPTLPHGSANLYVNKKSTVGIELHLDDEFEVWLPSLASAADWQLVFGVLGRSAELFDTVFVTWNDGDVWELAELIDHCDEAWQLEQHRADNQTALSRAAAAGTVVVKGPIRSAHIGSWVLRQVAADVVTLEDVLLRTNYVDGPHLVAVAAVDAGQLVTVLGPGLRTLLPPADAVLLDTVDAAHTPVLVSSTALDEITGLGVTRLDEGHRLVQPVPESAWPAILTAALPHAL